MAVPSLQQQANLLIRFIDEPQFFAQFRQDPHNALAEYDFDDAFIEQFHKRFKSREDIEEHLDTLSELLGEEKAGPPGIPAMVESEGPMQRIVNTGFAPTQRPDEPLAPSRTLDVNGRYHFWFDISNQPLENSIELTPTSLPPDLPGDAELDIVLFEFPSQGQLIVGNTHGKLKLDGNTAKVIKPADTVDEQLEAVELGLRRLFFTVQTPNSQGKYQLRNNIYFQGNLLQSRLITFHVTNGERNRHNALTSELDFAVSKTFAPDQLARMGQNHLSVLLNDDGDGTHGLRLFGRNEFTGSATLGADALKTQINTSRQELRRAAWGNKEPFKEGNSYLYAGDLNLKRLSLDLIRMARRGYEFYNAVIVSFAGGVHKSYELADLMREPGQVQIASKETIQTVLPAAMIYDYPLDDGYTDPAKYSICPEFLQNLQGDQLLESTLCFQGKCPSYDEDTVICPSGFWGFRHYLGLPVSIKSAPDAPLVIFSTGTPSLAMSVSTDPQFTHRPDHEASLQKMQVGWSYADNRGEALDLMKQNQAQIVYFYCHGGLANGRPYIKVGPNDDGERLTPTNLRNKRILFDEIRPLVFINGCHTTALTPDNGFDMVSAFIQTSHAAGVIGTEITIFESIAVTFAEAFFDRFLLKKESVGESVRGARLEMLRKGNPLGLVYVPYAMPSLKLS